MDRRFVPVVLVSFFAICVLLSSISNSQPLVEAASNIVFVTTDGNCNGAIPCYSNLQTAVDSVEEGGIIKVAGGMYTGVTTSSSYSTDTFTATQLLLINKNIRIIGGFTSSNWNEPSLIPNTTFLDAQGSGRVIFITGNVDVELENLWLMNGEAAWLGGHTDGDAGGGIYNAASSVEIKSTVIADNDVTADSLRGDTCTGISASGYGGGLYNSTNSTILLENTVLDRNTVQPIDGACFGGGLAHGGAIYNDGQLILNNADFFQNIATGAVDAGGGSGFGGAIFNSVNGDLTYTNGFVNGNNVYSGSGVGGGSTSGGAIFNDGGSVKLVDLKIDSNAATSASANFPGNAAGGAIYNGLGGMMHVETTAITNNQAKGGPSTFDQNGDSFGAGIFNAGILTLESTLVENNIITAQTTSTDRIDGAGGFGGGIYSSGTLTVSNSLILDNSVTGDTGGGNDGSSNWAGAGGAAYGGGIYSSGTTQIKGSVVDRNRAIGGAPGSLIAFDGGNGFGGGLYSAAPGSLTIADSSVKNNQANGSGGSAINGGLGQGGGIWSNTSLIIAEATIAGNSVLGGSTGDYGGDASGGGLHHTGSLPANISSSFILSNMVTGGIGIGFGTSGVALGGGVYSAGAHELQLDGSVVANNRVIEATGNNPISYGGGMYNSGNVFTAANSVFMNNVSDTAGDALYLTGVSAEVEHTTLTNHQAGSPMAVSLNENSSANFINTIIVSNDTGVMVDASSDVNLNAVLWHDNLVANVSGDGTIVINNALSGDPQFSVDGYHLTAGSPAIDQAVAAANQPVDIDLENRPFGSGSDLGADEYIPAAVDLSAGAIEVTQAIQDLNNSVRLVANKRTYVRFHAYVDNGAFLTNAELLLDNGIETVTLDPINPGGQIVVRKSPNRAYQHHAFLFELPSNFLQGSVSITAVLNPESSNGVRSPIETNYANNSRATTVTFETVPVMNLILYRIGYGSDLDPIYPDELHVQRLTSWLQQAYPISDLQYSVRTAYIGTDVPSCGEVNSYLFTIQNWEKANGTVAAGTRYYGLVADDVAFMRGCAWIGNTISSGPAGTSNWGWDFDGSYADWYGGHELAHNYGRFHAEFCGASGGADYPYADGFISPPLTGNNSLYGFNIDTQTIYGPDWTDVMTYCPFEWVSDFTYEGILDYFQTNLAGKTSIEAQTDAVDRLMVVGTIDRQTLNVSMQPFFVIPDAEDLEPRIPGDYEIVLRNQNGVVLATYPFTPDEISGGPDPGNSNETHLAGISELVPYIIGTTRVDIEQGNNILYSLSVGSGTPEVSITSPVGGETYTNDEIEIVWDASDPDADSLTFTLEYSADNGNNWLTVAQNIQDNSYKLSARQLPAATQGLFRVWVTDGIHTANDTTNGSFTISNKVPSVQILLPDENRIISDGQTVSFAASAYDPDSGSMRGAKLEWSSDREGIFGFGENLVVTNLSLGTHQITVTANDGQGGSAQDAVQIIIVSDLSDMPAVASQLQIAPNLIRFDLEQNVTSKILSVENLDPNEEISWSASADAAWVQLSQDNGVTADEIVVSYADLGLMPGNYTATVTFTSADLPDEIVAVNIQLTIPGEILYLPIIVR